jgi:hypothetical protein
MNRIILSVCIMVCIGIVSCKKGKQYSTWNINGEDFSANNVGVFIVDSEFCYLTNNDTNNQFLVGFFNTGSRLPVNGTFKLNTYPAGATPDCDVQFHYKGKTYHPTFTNTGVIHASSINEKASYTLPASWFIPISNLGDSVLIEGTFNEP